MSPDQIKRAIRIAMAGVRSAFLGVVGNVKRTSPVQRATVDGLAGEAIPGVEIWQHFGFTSTPPAGTQAIVLPLGGRTSASVIVATEAAAVRLVLNQAGEVAIYNQDGDYVWLKRNGHIKVKSALEVTIDAPTTNMTGNLAVAGNVSAGGNVTAIGTITDKLGAGGKAMDQMRTTFNSHDHNESNTPGGHTATPNQTM